MQVIVIDVVAADADGARAGAARADGAGTDGTRTDGLGTGARPARRPDDARYAADATGSAAVGSAEDGRELRQR